MDSTASTPQTPATPNVPLEVTNQQNSALLEDTLTLLNAGIPDQQDQHGLVEIERWEAVLQASERPGLAKIIQELAILRQQLTASDTETHDLAETMATLGAEAAKVADDPNAAYAAPLGRLSKLLIKVGSSLSR